MSIDYSGLRTTSGPKRVPRTCLCGNYSNWLSRLYSIEILFHISRAGNKLGLLEAKCHSAFTTAPRPEFIFIPNSVKIVFCCYKKIREEG